MYSGNISNWGLIGKAGEWLYYCNSHDNHTLYKIKIDGTGRKKLSSEDTRFIHVLGDWIYYVEYDGANEHREGRAICKVRTDGSEKIELIRDNAGEISSMFVYNNWIFYWKTEYSPDENNSLRKINTDGEDDIEICDGRAGYINVSEGIVYFLSNEGHICRIKDDGTERMILADDDCESLIVFDKEVYYCNFSDGHSLYKMKKDGTERTKIISDSVFMFNIKEDWIYYGNSSDKDKLYKVCVDGREKTLVCEDSVSSIFVLDDWIYYRSSGNLYGFSGDGVKRNSLL